jgi:two-component system KDP operon response regulator KdpE
MAIAHKPDEPAPLVLIIDDERQIRRLLAICLEGQGLRVRQAETGQEGLVLAAERPPDVVLLDLRLPDMEGLDALKRLREWSSAPVIVLSVRADEAEKVKLLDAGADDYMVKPFSSGELMARVRAALRHARLAGSPGEETVINCGGLKINLATRDVTVCGKPVRLTPTEFALLRFFARHAGKVLTHAQIMQEVWGDDCLDKTHYLHVYVTHLRNKIESNPSAPEILVNEARIGYRLVKSSPKNECAAV